MLKRHGEIMGDYRDELNNEDKVSTDTYAITREDYEMLKKIACSPTVCTEEGFDSFFEAMEE